MKKKICLFLYKAIAIHLPNSDLQWWGGVKVGRLARKIRYLLCRNIFEYCGQDVNIQKGARFGRGFHLRIGDNSALGVNCVIPDGSVIGKDVMMGPNCYIHHHNHSFDRTDIPMCLQGFTENKPIIIEDDVWIGRDVSIMAGRHISRGTIIAANCVLTKDFPEYSIVGGNPSRLIRSRKQDILDV